MLRGSRTWRVSGGLPLTSLPLSQVPPSPSPLGCEFLEKLDLTVNFVGDLLSIESLRANSHLRELYLTGNPCTDYEGYREFVVATLPQLAWLDGKEISRSERIAAVQRYEEVRGRIEQEQEIYQRKRVSGPSLPCLSARLVVDGSHSLLQEDQRREHEQKEGTRGGEKRPGFDGRWYTDPNAHLQPK